MEVWCTFFGLSSTSVILEGSTMGLGLRRFSIRLCHWVGRPTKHPCLVSNEVWTRCSKFLGADISGLFFFFLRNILRSTRATACLLQNVPGGKNIQPYDSVIILTFQYRLISSAPVIKKILPLIDPSHWLQNFSFILWPGLSIIRDDLSTWEKDSNGSSQSCSMSGICMLVQLCQPSQARASENDSKDSGWIWKHMCNEGYLVN